MEAVFNAIVEGLTKFAGEIIAALLLTLAFWVFPSLRSLFRKDKGSKENEAEIQKALEIYHAFHKQEEEKKAEEAKRQAEIQRELELKRQEEERLRAELQQREEALRLAEAEKAAEAKRREEIERELEAKRREEALKQAEANISEPTQRSSELIDKFIIFFIETRRKTPSFSHGDIRRSLVEFSCLFVYAFIYFSCK